MSQDELRTAIRVARKIFGDSPRPVDDTTIVLCALVRAVEILAEQQDKQANDDNDGAVEDVADLRAKVNGLEKRLAELSTPSAVDGKTPGEVLILAQHGLRPFQVSREMVESAEHAAGAVLRAFGNSPSGQTTPTNATETLRTVVAMLGPIRVDRAACVEIMKVIDFIENKITQLESFAPDTSTESGLPDAVLREHP